MPLLLALRFWEPAPAPPAPPPPSVAPPVDVCFPTVSGPATSFGREAAPIASYARGAPPTLSYARATLGALGATRAAAPVTGFGQSAEPSPGAASGYGDEYGFDYGGGASTVPSLPSVAAGGRLKLPVTTFSRAPELSDAYARQAVAGSFQRAPALAALVEVSAASPAVAFDLLDEPECVAQSGYGDDYGFNYGGGADGI